MNTITFSNHLPIQTQADLETIWDGNQEWGHHRIYGIRTQKGNVHIWESSNSGCSYNGRNPKTTREHLFGGTVEEAKSWVSELRVTSDPGDWTFPATQDQVDALRGFVGIAPEIVE